MLANTSNACQDFAKSLHRKIKSNENAACKFMEKIVVCVCVGGLK